MYPPLDLLCDGQSSALLSQPFLFHILPSRPSTPDLSRLTCIIPPCKSLIQVLPCPVNPSPTLPALFCFFPYLFPLLSSPTYVSFDLPPILSHAISSIPILTYLVSSLSLRLVSIAPPCPVYPTSSHSALVTFTEAYMSLAVSRPGLPSPAAQHVAFDGHVLYCPISSCPVAIRTSPSHLTVPSLGESSNHAQPNHGSLLLRHFSPTPNRSVLYCVPHQPPFHLVLSLLHPWPQTLSFSPVQSHLAWVCTTAPLSIWHPQILTCSVSPIPFRISPKNSVPSCPILLNSNQPSSLFRPSPHFWVPSC